MKKQNAATKTQIDWLMVIAPLSTILIICIIFFIQPEKSNDMLSVIRDFLGDDMGLYYILAGIGAFGVTLFMAFSKYGNIILGNPKDKDADKPLFSSFVWGSMIFTSTMAADTLFYSLCEWTLYAAEPHIQNMDDPHLWMATMPLFNWGPVAWSFYIVTAVAFAFMLHVRGQTKQKFSQACRGLLGNRVDGQAGRFIDLLAVFAQLAGGAISFSFSTPLLAGAIARVFGISSSTALSIVVLLIICIIYTCAVLFGIKGVSKLAVWCVYLFVGLLIYVLLFAGETRFILEMGVSSLGNMTQNFINLTTWTDPLRENSYPQNWTIFYWAYWLSCCVGTPFFVGIISKGRSVKNTVIGAYFWGLAGTFTSFIILGNYGLAQQAKHGLDSAGAIANGDSISQVVINIFDTLPLPALGLILLAVTMILFYATTFDAVTYVISGYSYKELKENTEPGKRMRTFWSIVLIMLPIALIFSESSIANLQSVAMITAFPIGLVIIIIVVSFFKDAKKLLDENKN